MVFSFPVTLEGFEARSREIRNRVIELYISRSGRSQAAQDAARGADIHGSADRMIWQSSKYRSTVTDTIYDLRTDCTFALPQTTSICRRYTPTAAYGNDGGGNCASTYRRNDASQIAYPQLINRCCRRSGIFCSRVGVSANSVVRSIGH
jgi:hypothetical protein